MIVAYPYLRARRVRDLIKQEGELLVHCVCGEQNLLVRWRDFTNVSLTWSVIPVSRALLDEYLTGQISLRTLMEEIHSIWRIEGTLHEPLHFEEVAFNDIEEADRPTHYSFYTADA